MVFGGGGAAQQEGAANSSVRGVSMSELQLYIADMSACL